MPSPEFTNPVVIDPEIFDSIQSAIKEIQTATIVSCPLSPKQIEGVTAAAYTANDCIGKVFKVKVPRRGEIRSATLYNLSDVTNQTDLAIFRRAIISAGDNSAYSPSDTEIVEKVTTIAFVSSTDDINSRTFEVTNIGKAYVAPDGYFYIQAIDRAGQTLVANNIPKVQIDILSFDHDFMEV